MGLCLPCLDSGSSSDYDDRIPEDSETKRRQQAEAAEKRLQNQGSRGIKNPAAVKRKQQKREEMENIVASQPQTGGGAPLRWQVG